MNLKVAIGIIQGRWADNVVGSLEGVFLD